MSMCNMLAQDLQMLTHYTKILSLLSDLSFYQEIIKFGMEEVGGMGKNYVNFLPVHVLLFLVTPLKWLYFHKYLRDIIRFIEATGVGFMITEK